MLIKILREARAGQTLYLVNDDGVLSNVVIAHLVSGPYNITSDIASFKFLDFTPGNECVKDDFLAYSYSGWVDWKPESHNSKVFKSRRKAEAYAKRLRSEYRQRILGGLLDIKRKVNSYRSVFLREGICDGLSRSTGAYFTSSIRSAFEAWPKFSGYPGYPISETNTPGIPPSLQFNYAGSKLKLWDKTTNYGRLRHELLDFMIEYFSNLQD